MLRNCSQLTHAHTYTHTYMLGHAKQSMENNMNTYASIRTRTHVCHGLQEVHVMCGRCAIHEHYEYALMLCPHCRTSRASPSRACEEPGEDTGKIGQTKTERSREREEERGLAGWGADRYWNSTRELECREAIQHENRSAERMPGILQSLPDLSR